MEPEVMGCLAFPSREKKIIIHAIYGVKYGRTKKLVEMSQRQTKKQVQVNFSNYLTLSSLFLFFQKTLKFGLLISVRRKHFTFEWQPVRHFYSPSKKGELSGRLNPSKQQQPLKPTEGRERERRNFTGPKKVTKKTKKAKLEKALRSLSGQSIEAEKEKAAAATSTLLERQRGRRRSRRWFRNLRRKESQQIASCCHVQ